MAYNNFLLTPQPILTMGGLHTPVPAPMAYDEERLLTASLELFEKRLEDFVIDIAVAGRKHETVTYRRARCVQFVEIFKLLDLETQKLYGKDKNKWFNKDPKFRTSVLKPENYTSIIAHRIPDDLAIQGLKNFIQALDKYESKIMVTPRPTAKTADGGAKTGTGAGPGTGTETETEPAKKRYADSTCGDSDGDDEAPATRTETSNKRIKLSRNEVIEKHHKAVVGIHDARFRHTYNVDGGEAYVSALMGEVKCSDTETMHRSCDMLAAFLYLMYERKVLIGGVSMDVVMATLDGMCSEFGGAAQWGVLNPGYTVEKLCEDAKFNSLFKVCGDGLVKPSSVVLRYVRSFDAFVIPMPMSSTMSMPVVPLSGMCVVKTEVLESGVAAKDGIDGLIGENIDMDGIFSEAE